MINTLPAKTRTGVERALSKLVAAVCPNSITSGLPPAAPSTPSKADIRAVLGYQECVDPADFDWEEKRVHLLLKNGVWLRNMIVFTIDYFPGWVQLHAQDEDGRRYYVPLEEIVAVAGELQD